MSRPIRDTPGDTTRITTAILSRNGCPAPEAVTAELMAAYLGNHLAIIDTTPPEDPNANPLTRPAHITPATDAATEYQQAKAAIAKNRPTARRGLTIPRQCGCGCVKGFCQCAGNPCACAPCPLCHPAPPEPQEGQP